MVALLASPQLVAQIVGGDFEEIRRWPGPHKDAGFGGSVADAGDIDGDGYSDIIVGKSDHKIGGLKVGTAAVISGATNRVIRRWYGTIDGARFGGGVHGIGDINADGYPDVLITATFQASGGMTRNGSVYLYSGFDGSLLLNLHGPNSYGDFGSTVAAVGDIDGDGHDDFMVGARYAGTGSMWRNGRAFLYSGQNGQLIHEWSGESDSDIFGSALACAGDINQDGVPDLIIGGPRANASAFWAGSAYVFSGVDGSLLLRIDGEYQGDQFGSGVAGLGDINADGIPDFAIGASWGDPLGRRDAGRIYAVSGADGSLIYRLLGEASGDEFGSRMKAAADFDGDGISDLLVGIYLADPDGIRAAGSAYLYSGAGGGLILKWNGQKEYDYLGIGMVGTSDLNGDGSPEFIVGAPGVDLPGMDDAGEIVVYQFNPFLTSSHETISAAAGGVLDFELDFPADAAAMEYKVLLSASGTGPTQYGVLIPLTLDSFVTDSFVGNYPVSQHSGMHGHLNADGIGSAQFILPAGHASSLIGSTFHFAAISNPTGLEPHWSSAAVAITIEP